MGIELLQEASNVAALQQMYRSMGAPGWPGPLPPPPGLPASVTPMLSSLSSLDLYYRQAAAAHSLQRPFPYKLGSPPAVPGTPLPPSAPTPLLPLPQLPPLSLPTASSILQEMSTEAMRSASPPPAHSPVSLTLTRPASVSPPRQSPSCVEPAPASVAD